MTTAAKKSTPNTEDRQKAPTLRRIISFNEACDYLAIKRATLYSMLNEKRVPGFKLEGSRVWKFDVRDLDQWIENQKGANHGN